MARIFCVGATDLSFFRGGEIACLSIVIIAILLLAGMFRKDIGPVIRGLESLSIEILKLFKFVVSTRAVPLEVRDTPRDERPKASDFRPGTGAAPSDAEDDR